MFFAGHQVLLVTHTNGHNHSGNIHTHMVLNSVRKDNVIWRDFMERPADAQAGYKHHQSRELLRRMQRAVNEICDREHLSTVDYSLPTEKKVTDREYRAKRDGQEKLEETNRAVLADGLKPRRTKYETIMDQIREAVDYAAREAENGFGVQLVKQSLKITNCILNLPWLSLIMRYDEHIFIERYTARGWEPYAAFKLIWPGMQA